MIITQKVTYLAFSLHDGKRNVKCLKDFIAEFNLLKEIIPQMSAKYPRKIRSGRNTRVMYGKVTRPYQHLLSTDFIVSWNSCVFHAEL